MQRLRNPRTGIDQGDLVLFSEFDSGGSMWTGEGARERRKLVRFKEAYRRPPAVQVSISLWDMDTNAAIRAELVAENITTTDFEVVFRTWGDSRIARLRAAWIAVGELPFDDDWDDVD
ncbi:H-type lectin domain-containing protein [Pseudophaeobacter sp.]|uniref:H-type lectin domain-containing protein n=1 Tax=Pseudophaeobacter sp. TaxID=1971739 RepID=UPI0032978E49